VAAMSRRSGRPRNPNGREPRPKPQRRELLGKPTTVVKIVCTDQRQHPEVEFGHMTVWRNEDGSHGFDWKNWAATEYVDHAAIDRAGWGLGPIPERTHKTQRFKCSRCGRDVPLRQETMERICAALADADTPRLDLSAIPSDRPLDL